MKHRAQLASWRKIVEETPVSLMNILGESDAKCVWLRRHNATWKVILRLAYNDTIIRCHTALAHYRRCVKVLEDI